MGLKVYFKLDNEYLKKYFIFFTKENWKIKLLLFIKQLLHNNYDR